MLWNPNIVRIFVEQTLKNKTMTTKTEQVVKINRTELINVLRNIKLNTFIGLVTNTEPSMLKTGNPFYDKQTKTFSVRKVSQTSYRTSNYEQRVKNNMIKEGLNPETFVVSKPSGKTHVEGSECLLVSDKNPNVFYLMVERFGENKPTVEYLHNGNPIDKMLLNDYLEKSYESTKQEQDKKVSVITPLVSNIVKMTMDGVCYEVE